MKTISKKKPCPWLISFLATLGFIILALASLLVYTRISDDRSPFGLAGLTYGVAGLLFMVLATLAYTLVRRSRKRTVGALNASLYWHISFGVIALFLIFLHAFGNFEPVSGTYALYSLVALVISGMLGRMLDRFVPNLIAREVKRTLTKQGEDRLELVTQKLQDIPTSQEEQAPSFKSQSAVLVPNKEMQTLASQLVSQNSTALSTSWDLAYISLAEFPQVVERDAMHSRFIADRKPLLSKPEVPIPGMEEHIQELHDVQQALQRERFYRAIIRYWRVCHICLALLTVGLTLWHLEYASTILIPIWFQH